VEAELGGSAYLLDGVGGGDELRVVVVDQRLALAVQAADLADQRAFHLQHAFQRLRFQQPLHVCCCVEAVAVQVAEHRRQLLWCPF